MSDNEFIDLTEIEEQSQPKRKRVALEKTMPKSKPTRKTNDDKFFCSPQLLEWHDNNTLRKELDCRNTNQVKAICYENNIPRSGAKYKIIGLLLAHAREAAKRRMMEKVKEDSEYDPSKIHELAVCKFKSFTAASNYTMKHIGGIDKCKTLDEKLALITGLSRGFDSQLLIAITGPRAGHYNGKYSEEGIDANRDVAYLWLEFFKKNYQKMNLEFFQRAIDACNYKSECSDFGFHSYVEIIHKELAALFQGQDEEMKAKAEIVATAFAKCKCFWRSTETK